MKWLSATAARILARLIDGPAELGIDNWTEARAKAAAAYTEAELDGWAGRRVAVTPARAAELNRERMIAGLKRDPAAVEAREARIAGEKAARRRPVGVWPAGTADGARHERRRA